MKRRLIAALLLAISSPAGAQSALELKGSLVEVRPGPKRYFYQSEYGGKGCPARTAACRRKAYVLPGDQLVATEVKGEFTHVEYLAPHRTDPTDGWMESSALRPVTQAKPSGWAGHWVSWDNEIDIAAGRGGGLRISGEALWGSRDPDRVERGGVHVGQIDGVLTARGGHMVYRDSEDGGPDGCVVEMRLLGPYLIVEDNRGCGGANVSFGGVYRR